MPTQIPTCDLASALRDAETFHDLYQICHTWPKEIQLSLVKSITKVIQYRYLDESSADMQRQFVVQSTPFSLMPYTIIGKMELYNTIKEAASHSRICRSWNLSVGTSIRQRSITLDVEMAPLPLRSPDPSIPRKPDEWATIQWNNDAGCLRYGLHSSPMRDDEEDLGIHVDHVEKWLRHAKTIRLGPCRYQKVDFSRHPVLENHVFPGVRTVILKDRLDSIAHGWQAFAVSGSLLSIWEKCGKVTHLDLWMANCEDLCHFVSVRDFGKVSMRLKMQTNLYKGRDRFDLNFQSPMIRANLSCIESFQSVSRFQKIDPVFFAYASEMTRLQIGGSPVILPPKLKHLKIVLRDNHPLDTDVLGTCPTLEDLVLQLDFLAIWGQEPEEQLCNSVVRVFDVVCHLPNLKRFVFQIGDRVILQVAGEANDENRIGIRRLTKIREATVRMRRHFVGRVDLEFILVKHLHGSQYEGRTETFFDFMFVDMTDEDSFVLVEREYARSYAHLRPGTLMFGGFNDEVERQVLDDGFIDFGRVY